jgi:hypothetical protein
MKILPVNNRKRKKDFLSFPRKLYSGDPNYVIPFDSEINLAFDRKVNPYFKHGDAVRWIAVDEKEKVVGRIAAFFDRDKDEAGKIKSGGCGFFESINDKDYYRELFEAYGFNLYYRQLSFQLDLENPFPERFWKIAEWINKRKGYSYRHFDPERTSEFVNNTVSIYNDAWRLMRKDFTPLDPDSLHDELRKIKDIIDPQLIWYAYFEGLPIAFFTFLPDANQIFKHLNGKLHLINKLRFLYYKRNNSITRCRGTAAGVVPKFQNSGVESGIFWQLNEVMKSRPHYKHVELAWVGDFNPKMIALYQATGAQHTKTHITYRYLFDRELVFERFMSEVIDESKLPTDPLISN